MLCVGSDGAVGVPCVHVPTARCRPRSPTTSPSCPFPTTTQVEAQLPAQEHKQPSKPGGPTPEQLTAIKAAIAAAGTLEEVRRLEEALTTGQLPSQFQGDADGMDED